MYWRGIMLVGKLFSPGEGDAACRLTQINVNKVSKKRVE